MFRELKAAMLLRPTRLRENIIMLDNGRCVIPGLLEYAGARLCKGPPEKIKPEKTALMNHVKHKLKRKGILANHVTSES